MTFYAKSIRGGSPLTISGKTLDGRPVVRGVFQWVSTYGLPLEVILDGLQKSGLMVDWLHFYDECIKEGWRPEGVKEKIRSAVGDIYGREHGEETIRRLETCLKNR